MRSYFDPVSQEYGNCVQPSGDISVAQQMCVVWRLPLPRQTSQPALSFCFQDSFSSVFHMECEELGKSSDALTR